MERVIAGVIIHPVSLGLVFLPVFLLLSRYFSTLVSVIIAMLLFMSASQITRYLFRK